MKKKTPPKKGISLYLQRNFPFVSVVFSPKPVDFGLQIEIWESFWYQFKKRQILTRQNVNVLWK